MSSGVNQNLQRQRLMMNASTKVISIQRIISQNSSCNGDNQSIAEFSAVHFANNQVQHSLRMIFVNTLSTGFSGLDLFFTKYP